ncbi:uncharacterized protein YbjQ (UPF0145 family) [Shewanella fodinae]|uniref:Uncharacterized protein YbjQ (UPF0145 family) n=2 Tax=Shewanella fodinae TaxID=552357 RepID=A0A4R2FF19_9GAMM|nr:uncharacterized protein YbjQ (UPF0145 family) [Shewanella fodinae]
MSSSVPLVSKEQTRVINEYRDTKLDAYCNECGSNLYRHSCYRMSREINKLTEKMQELINAIPVVSTHSPLNWDYNILDMVTGQSTTGTGVISEFTSSFTDLFGAQSKRHNQKLKAGEDMCFAQLRRQVMQLGGHAVIATDIDYSELGAGKGMIMVCMAGTAVKLNNLDILGEERVKQIAELFEVDKQLSYLQTFKLE